MTFNGSNKIYKRTLMLGIPLSIVLFCIAILTQGDDFAFMNALLFTVGGGVLGGMVGVPLAYMFGSKKRVVLTEDELRLEEGKRPKVAKYSDIQDVKYNGRQIIVKLRKGRITIINMHGYPLKEIYQHLEEKRAKKSS